eukprot:TRINITY_DN100587_c0_g1_i1.p1 TRINITY_DN100587_c0_g1~~TRINITY_DN100587_c0_g1_i1.p1  ORF type:complete len:252 (+),score=71.49 TRINITY_DN100587_c0_g1_i1:81-836(+)
MPVTRGSSKLLAASLAAGAFAFCTSCCRELGGLGFLQAAPKVPGVDMQRRALLPAAAVGALAAALQQEEPAAAADSKGKWTEKDGRMTFSAGDKAAFSFALPKDGSFFKTPADEVERAGKDPTQIAIYERKDGAVLEVGRLPKIKNYLQSVKNDLIRPLSGQKVVKLEDTPTGGLFEFVQFPQATSSFAFGSIGFAEKKTKAVHYWFSSVKDANGEGALIYLEAPCGAAAFEEIEKPKLLEIIDSLRLESA